MQLENTLSSALVVPVIVVDDADQAVPLARALVKGGLSVLEITFRTEAAAEAIARIKAEVPDAVVGAGTLVRREQVAAAKAAGAVFGVAPGFDPAIVAFAQENDLPIVPGVATASELSQAITAGEAAADVVFRYPSATGQRLCDAHTPVHGGTAPSRRACSALSRRGKCRARCPCSKCLEHRCQ